MLIGAVYDKDSEGYSLLSFTQPTQLNIPTDSVFLYHSKDDPVVPFSVLQKYQVALPKAQIRIFEDRKHLNQPEFPELVEDIKLINQKIMPHIHEKIDFCADVFVVYKDKVLIRKHDKYNIWLAVGGHIELDEDPNQAAIREVKEEVGLDITLLDTRNSIAPEDRGKELIPPVGINRHKISDTHEHISFFYVGTSNTDKVVPEDPSNTWKWCAEEDIDKLEGITSNIVFYAKLALKLTKVV